MRRIRRSLLFVMWMLCVIGFVHCNVLSISAEELVTEDGYEYTVLEDGTVEITGYTGTDTELVIPSEIEGKSVTSIGGYAFYNNNKLTSIRISDNVTNIGRAAFYACQDLTSINFPDSLTSIGEAAFYHSSLTSIIIPKNVTSIGERPFGSGKLISIKVDKENTVYNSGNNCNAIIETETNKLIQGCKNTTISSSVKSIGDRAFEACSGLKSIIIPKSVTRIGYMAFWGCIDLTDVVMSSSVVSIGGMAFQDCKGLANITIPSSVTSIGEDMLLYCPTTLVVYTSVGSVAASYAEENGFTVKSIEEAPAIELNGADVAIDGTITTDDLFIKYPSSLRNWAHHKTIQIIYDDCAESIDIYNSSLTKKLWASFKYGLTDGADVLVRSTYGALFGQNKVYRDFMDGEVEALMVTVTGSDWLVAEAVEKVDERYDTKKLIKDVAGNAYDATQKKQLIEALMDSGYFNEKQARNLCEVVEDRFEDIDAEFDKIGTTIEIADAIITVAQITSIKIEIVDTVMESIPKDSNFYDSLCRLRKKMTSKEYLAWVIGEEKIFDEITDFLTEVTAYAGIRCYSDIALKDASPAIFFGKLAVKTWAYVLPSPSADDLIKANMNIGIFDNLASAVNSKYAEILTLCQQGAPEKQIREAQAEYEILYTAHIEALRRLLNSATTLTEPTALEKFYSFFGVKVTMNDNIKRYHTALEYDATMIKELSYDKYLNSCLNIHVKQNSSQYLYSVKNGKATIIGCAVPSSTVSDVQAVNNAPLMQMSSLKVVGTTTSGVDKEDVPTYNSIVIIPEKIGDIPITNIESGAFAGNLENAIVLLPDTIESIATDAFDTDAHILIVGKESQGIEACAVATGNEVRVMEDKVSSIEIVSLPDKLSYSGNELLDETGMCLKVVYADGTEEEISNGWFSNIEKRTIGTNQVNVNYADCYTSYEVTVTEGEVNYTVYYQDDNGNNLIEPVDFKGTLGADVDIMAEDIPFYTPEENVIHTTLNEDMEIIVVYHKDSATSIENANISVDREHYYTGKKIEPEVKVVLDGVELQKNVDYEVDYFSNVEVGTAEILVWGIGLYDNDLITTFEIKDVLKTVVFEYDNGSENLSQQVKLGEVVKEPEVPIKAGFVFDGWYYKNQPDIKYDFSNAVTEDIILIAKWTKVQDTTTSTETPPEALTEKVCAQLGETYTIDSSFYTITSTDELNLTVAWSGQVDKNGKYISIPAEVTINETVYKVTSIASNACKGNKKVKRITIGENIITIGDKAFNNCKNLTKITIPSKVTEIGSYAFKNCKKLSSVTIGKNVKKIGKEAFRGCSKLKKITIKSSKLKSVGKNAIKGIDKKATIKVPKKKLSKYKKLFKSKTGYKKTMKIKK